MIANAMKPGLHRIAGWLALFALPLAGCEGISIHHRDVVYPAIYTVGGTVSGLSGSGLYLRNNGIDTLAVNANGSFTFSETLATGAAYSVSVFTQPGSPNQDCTVTNGSGTVTGADVTTVAVDCVVKSFKLQLGAGTIGTAASSNDFGAGVAMDAQGNLFVAAETTGSLGEDFAGGRDVVLVKVDSAGVLQWVKQYGNVTIGAGASGTERVVATAVDGAGNVIILGTTTGSFGEANAGSSDALVMKVSPVDGAVIWIRQFGSVSAAPFGSAALAENTKGLGVDPDGNIYISGRTTGSLGEANAGSQDLFAAKLDAAGNILWIKQLGYVTLGAAAAGDDTTFGALAVDASGNAYFTGATRGNLAEANSGAGSTYDFVVAKLDTDGALQWITQLGSVTGGAGSGMNDYDDGIAVDGSGNVYAVGQTFGSLGEANAGSNDGFVFKLNASGALQWIKQYGNVTAGASASDEFYSVTVGADNNVYISGQTRGDFAETNGGSGNMDAIVLKLDPSGNDIFIKQLGNITLGAAAAGIDTASQRGLVVDSRNRIYVTGSTTGSLFETNAGLNDIFLFKMNESGDFE